MRKLLQILYRRRRWAWIAWIAYAAAVTFPHEQVQLLVGRMADRLTRPGLYRVSAGIGVGLAVALTVALLRRLADHPERRRISAFWVLTLALICGTWGVFTGNNTELVHYPQYFPEGAALVAMTLSPAESLAWIAIAAGLDEGYQYWVLYPRRVSAFDYNDIYMDLLGGAAGVLFAMAFLTCERRVGRARIWTRPGVIALAGVIGTGLVLWATGRMAMHQDDPHPHWFALSRQKTPFFSIVPALGPHHVHELTPAEGILLILATIAVYSAIDRKVRISLD
jgi:MFS family permease